MRISEFIPRFTKFELVLWGASVSAVTCAFLLGGMNSYLNLFASVTGVSALIFVAKGNVIGQVLTFVFAILYAVISFEQRYYGEMITYIGMTGVIAIVSVYAWIKHPSRESAAEVRVGEMSKKDALIMFALAVSVTAAFYSILDFLGTENIIFSTVSVTTSFLASYLSYRRIPEYALAYAANDVVLIILWVSASFNNISYLSMVACFATFLFNDIYGYFNWKRIRKNQKKFGLDS